MPSCCVIGCDLKKTPNNPSLSIHRLPRNESTKKKWLEAIGIENIKLNRKDVYVCSAHFDDKCFNKTMDVVRLRDDAVPFKVVRVPQKGANTSKYTVPQAVVGTSGIATCTNTTAMLPICYICLRTDVKFRKLGTLPEGQAELMSFCNQMCDYNFPDYYQFCPECISKLKKCLEFKNRCKLASTVLKSWMLTSVSAKVPLSEVHRYLPPPLSQLSFSNGKNIKVYEYIHEQPTLSSVIPIAPQIVYAHSRAKSAKKPTKKKVNQYSNINLVNNDFGITHVYTHKTKEEIQLQRDFQEKKLSIQNDITNRNADLGNDTTDQVNELEYDTTDQVNDLKNDTTGQVYFVENDTTDQVNELKNDTTEQVKVIENDTTGQVNVLDNDTTQQVKVIENDTTDQITVIGNDIQEEIIIFEYDSTDETSFTENDNTQGICVKNDTIEKVSLTDNDITIENDEIEENDDVEETDDIDINHDELNDSNSDSDESIKEIKQKIKMKKLSLILEGNTVPKFDIDELRCQLKYKFEKHGAVKDEKGNVINPNTVLNNLDKYSDFTLNRLRQDTLAPGPFRLNVIKRLLMMQDRFKEFENMFEITYLSDQNQMKEEFENRRNYPSYTNKPHHCEKCFMGFDHDKILKYHLKTKHDESLGYSCTLCQCFYKTLSAIQKHIWAFHTMVYKCKQCQDFITNSRQTARSHYSRHTGRTHVCRICGAQYRSLSSYYLHVNAAHPTNHVCQLCAAAFHNAVGLNFHTKRKHEGEVFIISPQNRRCDICNIIFVNKDVYTAHCSKQHPSTVQRIRRKNPKNPGPPQKTVTCPLCNKTGNYNYWLYKHYLSDHPDQTYENIKKPNHLCEQCGQRFRFAVHLKEHKNLHTGAKPFACDKCPAKFHRRQNLIIHAERHQPRRHVCEKCGKRFASAANLFVHMRIHIGNRRFKCDLCGKGFLHNVSLREHIRGVHQHIKRERKRTATQKPKT